MFEKVYEYIGKIPKGKVTTYKKVADSLGIKDIRIVGWALHANPSPNNIPCHRVVKDSGELTKGYAFGGKTAQKEKLISEGIQFVGSSYKVRQDFLLK